MPLFSSYPASPSIKMLYLGHSGAGKTGSLCSLAAAGYNVRILDLDEKAEVIRGFVIGDSKTNPKSIYLRERPGLWTSEQAASTASRISYVSCGEKFSIQGTKSVSQGRAWQTGNTLLNNWVDGENKYGNISKWTEQDVLVIDSFSRWCEAARDFHLAVNNRAGERPRAGDSGSNDYSAIYSYILDFLNLLKSKDIKCHVILIGHVVFMDPNRSGVRQTSSTTPQIKGFTQVLGNANISPQISQYFPHVIRAKSVGSEPTVRRTIVTNNDENIELITTAPLQVKQEYSLETGLAEYFRDVLSLSQQKETLNAQQNATRTNF